MIMFLFFSAFFAVKIFSEPKNTKDTTIASFTRLVVFVVSVVVQPFPFCHCEDPSAGRERIG